jgi:ABC-type oligopeptide transport system ATPase subunit
MRALLEVRDVAKVFKIRRGATVDAVKGVSFEIEKGRTYGLVGESGSGKSTVARMVAQLTMPTTGSIRFDGVDVAEGDRRSRLAYRRDVQIIFQDPFGALNPRMTVQELITEPLIVHKLFSPRERAERARRLVDDVGLPRAALERKPVDFSGGQRQRIMIARALALNPRLIVADEPVSALDVSVQAQVLNLLKDLQDERGLSYLFISHDLSVVEFISDTIGIMRHGELLEEGLKRDIYANPRTEYTRDLIAAIPTIEGAA